MLAIVYEGREYLVEGFKFERNRKFIMFKKVPGTRVVNKCTNTTGK
jgi:hypothetical protein